MEVQVLKRHMHPIPFMMDNQDGQITAIITKQFDKKKSVLKIVFIP